MVKENISEIYLVIILWNLVNNLREFLEHLMAQIKIISLFAL